jgi:hypothetical protein
VRAALAGNDRAELALWGRYLSRRFPAAAGTERAELASLVRGLDEKLADPERRRKRQKLERKIETGKLLKGRIGLWRAELDGSQEKARADTARLAHSRF